MSAWFDNEHVGVEKLGECMDVGIIGNPINGPNRAHIGHLKRSGRKIWAMQ